MKRTSSSLGVILFNLGSTLAGLFLTNLYFDYQEFTSALSMNVRKEVEARSDKFNAAYFKQCLSSSHLQVFYPDLLRRPDLRKLSRETGFLPLGPVPNRMTAYCNEGAGFALYRSDRFGFRNNDENWNRTVDVLLVGDSFVQGACVGDESTFTSLLARRLASNVVNVGTASNGPDHYRNLIDTFTPMVKPRRVVLFFYPNDNVDLAYEGNPFLAHPPEPNPSYSLPGLDAAGKEFYQKLLPLIAPSEEAGADKVECAPDTQVHPAWIAKIVADHAEIHRGGVKGSAFWAYLRSRLSGEGGAHFLKARAIRNLVRARLAGQQPQVLASPEATAAAIDALFHRCRDSCRPAIVLMAPSNYWRPDSRTGTYFKLISDTAATRAAGREFDLVDGRDVIDSDGLSDFSPLGGHYSGRGYEAISDLLARAIASPVSTR